MSESNYVPPQEPENPSDEPEQAAPQAPTSYGSFSVPKRTSDAADPYADIPPHQRGEASNEAGNSGTGLGCLAGCGGTVLFVLIGFKALDASGGLLALAQSGPLLVLGGLVVGGIFFALGKYLGSK